MCSWMIVQTSASAENIIQYSNDLSPSALQDCLLELFTIYLVSCNTLMVHVWCGTFRLLILLDEVREKSRSSSNSPAFHHILDTTKNSFAQQLDMSSPAFHPQLGYLVKCSIISIGMKYVPITVQISQHQMSISSIC